jgi:hypothetical protein
VATGLSPDRDLGGGFPPRRRLSLRTLFRRTESMPHPVPQDIRSARQQRLGEVCAVLEGARDLLDAGWVQDRWYVRQASPTARRGASSLRHRDAGPVTGACLVGAVVHATGQGDAEAGLLEAGSALDVLWDAWQESRGMGGAGVAGRAAPPDVRAARVRDLTRWNDQPGRTREEVLGLLDLAVSRAIMEAVEPSPTPSRRAR